MLSHLSPASDQGRIPAPPEPNFLPIVCEEALAAFESFEAPFRFLAEHTEVLILLTGRDGKHRYVSPASRTLLGYQPEELLRINARDTIHPEDVNNVMSALATGVQGGSLKFRLARKNGGYVWVEATSRVLDEPAWLGGNLMLVRDIEHRAEAERKLVAESQHHRRLDESTPAMLHSIDASGRILMVSDAWLKRLGYSRDEVLGRLATDFLTLDSRDYAQATVIPSFFQKGRCDDIEYEMVCKSGEIIQVRLSAILDPDRNVSLTVITDITLKRKVQRQFTESEARYRTLADHSSDIVFQLDAKLLYSYVSPACVEVLGREPDQLIGMNPVELSHPEDASQIAHVFEILLTGREDQRSTINRIRHRDGHWIWAEARLRSVKDRRNGSIIGIIGALRDVSERQKAAEELERARLAAEAATKLKAEFVANMSHELRTPLTSVLGALDILCGDLTLREDQRRYLFMAHEASQSLMAIVNDILDFSKIEAGYLNIEVAPFELNSAIEQCRRLIGEIASKKSIEINTITVGGPVTLLGDANRIKQIVLNLISNAIKFSDGGQVTIEAHYQRGHSKLRVAVSDTGIGIAPEKLTTIFERFTQADGSITRRYGGTGLGLSISKHLVQLMDGKMSVVSIPGKGSTFSLELPLSEIKLPMAAPLIGKTAATGSSWRILLAEDNQINREVICDVLRHEGHHVTAVSDGAAAVSTFANEARFDLIMMDLQMPAMDGLAATRAIRQAERAAQRPATPIVGLTANAMSGDKLACQQAGMNAHVAKPIRWSDLFVICEQLVDANRRFASKTECPQVVLDPSPLAGLTRLVGRARLSELLQAFIESVSERSAKLHEMGLAELSGYAHSCQSMSGQLGFVELSRICAEIQSESRNGGGLERISELLEATNRAVKAAHASEYGRAAKVDWVGASA